ncbi:armadillo-type protein, partial [Piptocephalis cylindrospora]
DSPEIITKKVKGLLNKLTLEKFESLSGKILEYANQSTEETDGTTLQLVIQLLFEKATDEPNFSNLYAQLAHRMLQRIDPEVRDENLRTRDGKVVAGGALFRKYLLTRCQSEYVKGWKVSMPENSGAEQLMSDEYYEAMKIKRRGLGLVKFIGELFKLDMLTEKIMHECVRQLLSNMSEPEEEEAESMSKLLTTVGSKLDRPEARHFMDVYFGRIRELSQSDKLSSRIRFMLVDLLELRSNGWHNRREQTGPKTIAQIH